ncbi:MAG: flagellar basal-body rod protein FlgG [Zoogloeaceae bacterium]|jgi:flagellar basal-body rod protein FlgG|nr:flagellar basal-body rod protein FlgG [Zoogloeaceae bacterium]
MIRSLWIARTGLNAQQTNIDVIANNLSNLSTNGYKKSRAVFEDLLYQIIRQPGAQSTQQTQFSNGLQLGTGVQPVSTARIFTQGPTQFTDNPLDIAINGEGFLQILMPDGTTAYSRAGALQKDNQGNIVTPDGFPLQPNINIPETALSVTISWDGIVTITQPGSINAPTQIGQIQVATFINPGGLLSIGANMFLESGSSGAPTPNTPGQNGAGTLRQRYVEMSNVDTAEELVSMIQAQRAYELNAKVVTTSDQMLARLAQM